MNSGSTSAARLPIASYASPEEPCAGISSSAPARRPARLRPAPTVAKSSISPRSGDPVQFWLGYQLRVLDRRGQVLASGRVADFDRESGTLLFEADLAASPEIGQPYTLISDEEAPLVAIRYLLGLPRAAAIQPVHVRLGTTRGTNALLTRRGARTAFVTTRGFADVLHIGYQNRPRLFDLDIVKPEPLFSAVAEIDERLAADGSVLQSPGEEQVRSELARLQSLQIDSLAICLLHASSRPAHEQMVAHIAQDMGFTEISVSHRVASLGKDRGPG